MSALTREGHMRLAAAAEARYYQIANDMNDGLMSQSLPTVDFLDDVIVQLAGIRSTISGDPAPIDETARHGLRRMLSARREDAAACLSDDRDALDGPDRGEATSSVLARIDAYEAEIAFIDHELDRLGAGREVV